MEENYCHQLSADNSLISVTRTLLQTSKYWLSGPGHGSNFVQGRAYRMVGDGGTTAVQNSCLLVELWRKITLINFRQFFHRFRGVTRGRSLTAERIW